MILVSLFLFFSISFILLTFFSLVSSHFFFFFLALPPVTNPMFGIPLSKAAQMSDIPKGLVPLPIRVAFQFLETTGFYSFISLSSFFSFSLSFALIFFLPLLFPPSLSFCSLFLSPPSFCLKNLFFFLQDWKQRGCIEYQGIMILWQNIFECGMLVCLFRLGSMNKRKLLV